MAFPVIVKPRYTFDATFPGKNAVFNNAKGLLTFFDGSELIEKSIVQQIIPSGDGDILVAASYSGADGTVKAMYSGRKIRQFRPDYGATCFGISERHLAIEEQSRTFLNNIGYKGFAALEFSRSRTDGRAYFLELNTRTYYHNQLFADAGVDLTQIGYLEMTGRDYETMRVHTVQREGLIWLDFLRDMNSIRIKRTQGKITYRQWLRSIVKARSFAYWNWRDPLPFFLGSLCLLKRLYFKLMRKARLRRRAPGSQEH
jgi:predicted ATP-grasp superfamily ATP-dependent carboligase